MKKLLFLGFLSITSSAFAQNIFWTFNDEQAPLTVAPECDAKFDEIQGGVFMPKIEEVMKQGEFFLANSSPEIQNQAPYCFLVAAFAGNDKAQFKLAQLYNEGKVLPKDDLSAYKWAFISALNGNKNGEKFALNLEQFLSTDDLEATSGAIQTTHLQIKEYLATKEMEQAQQIQTPESNGRLAPLPTKLSEIFTEGDRF